MDLRILHVAGEVWGDDARALLEREPRVAGRKLRIDVVRAASLRDACLHLRAVPFDVVLLDLSSRERGPASLHRLREVDAEVPVVVWACQLDPLRRAVWARAGVREFLDGDCGDGPRLLEALVRAAREAWTHGGDVVPKATRERHS